jgi:hypothetical protein
MLTVIYSVLALVPVLGIAFILVFGSPFTVDGLFMSLILLTMSGVVGTTELYHIWKLKHSPRRALVAAGAGRLPAQTVVDALLRTGKVRTVQFFEAPVGISNKSVVTLQSGLDAVQTLVFEGDMRNALPVGQKVQVSFRKEDGLNVLLNVSYS